MNDHHGTRSVGGEAHKQTGEGSAVKAHDLHSAGYWVTATYTILGSVMPSTARPWSRYALHAMMILSVPPLVTAPHVSGPPLKISQHIRTISASAWRQPAKGMRRVRKTRSGSGRGGRSNGRDDKDIITYQRTHTWPDVGVQGVAPSEHGVHLLMQHRISRRGSYGGEWQGAGKV